MRVKEDCEVVFNSFTVRTLKNELFDDRESERKKKNIKKRQIDDREKVKVQHLNSFAVKCNFNKQIRTAT